MNTHSKTADKIQPFPGLPLFDWHPVAVRHPLSRAGLHVMRRYRVAPHIAELIASLAGLGSESSR
jgi:hypothetical protein